MTVGERAREVGLLRAAGATRLQLSRFVFSGALLLGVTGSLARRRPRRSCSHALMAGAVSEATGLPAAVGSFDIAGAATAAAIGVAITVLAAIEPALAAARISPVEALRARFDLPSLRGGRLTWIAFIFLAVAAMAMLAWPPVLANDGRRPSHDGLHRAALRDPHLAVPHAAAGTPPRASRSRWCCGSRSAWRAARSPATGTGRR